LLNSEAIFRRSINYRLFPIETFFRWKPKIELNFTLAPIWGRGRIELDTTPGDKTEDWNFFLNSFGGSEDPVKDMGATDAMKSDWYGYTGMLAFATIYHPGWHWTLKGDSSIILIKMINGGSRDSL